MKRMFLFLLLQIGYAYTYAQDPAYPAAPAIAQNIIMVEYFIDDDPGLGNASPVSITPGVAVTLTVNTIDVSGLTNGVHRLGVRTRSNEGKWSMTAFSEFVVDFDPAYVLAPAAPQNIVAAEYFIDSDPGIGNGQTVSISTAVSLTDVSAAINTTGLANGVHRVYLRVKSNEGKWSLAEVRDFIVDSDPSYPTPPPVVQNVIQAAYFFDADPGVGNGFPISFSPGTNVQDITTGVNTAGLINGIHRIYIRTKNSEGQWSLTQVQDFAVDADPIYPDAPIAPQQVTAAEYFVDADPGIGNAQPIVLTAGLNISDNLTSIQTAGLSNGIHRVYIRTRNAEGRWSITAVEDFEVAEDYSYPVAPATAQNVITAEYFIDTDPGAGAGTPLVITPDTTISDFSVSVNTSGLSNGSHVLYLRTLSQEGKWSLTQNAVFLTDLMAFTPDSLLFGVVPVSTAAEKNIVVKNNSAVSQTINTMTIGSPFTTNTTTPLVLAAGASYTIKINFAPSGVGSYLDSIVFNTTTGNYTTVLSGSGIAQIPSWTIEPATGRDYGNVDIGNTGSYNFTIRNTGNIPITLSDVATGASAFIATFTSGTVIPANSTLSIPVLFVPSAVQQYSTTLKIQSSTAGVDSVTAQLSGYGDTAGTPPVLGYPTGGVYAGVSGVSPSVGQPGVYTYRILYQSANNKAPMAGYPRVSIDLNGDQNFGGPNEGIFAMVKEGAGSDYVTGVMYSYTYTHGNVTSAAGYAFDVKDEDGNQAAVSYKSGPVVTNDVLDLRIFANDISFSMANPAPGQSFTMTARISNSTAVPATNVPIRFYRDTIFIASDVLAAVPANGSSTITRTFNFTDEGFYPIKVWIDSAQTLGETNVLNNYAIRPVTVGSPALPGGITVTTTATLQQCPQLQVLIKGNAVYFGTGSNTPVAGAEVTISTGTQTFTTTTDANGNYSTLVTGVTCGSGNFAYAVTITDFTFTSTPISNSLPAPCTTPGTCATAPPSPGGILASASATPCSKVAGTTTSANFVIKLRERDITRFWSGFDYIADRSTLYIFHDDVLVSTKEYGSGLAPGQEIREDIPVPLPSGSTTPVKVTAVYSYTYVEFSQIPSSTYYGHFYNITEVADLSITPEPDVPDLSIRNFAQTSFTSFKFDAVNLACVAAGKHVVKVFDLAQSSIVPIKTDTIASLGGGAGLTISFSDPTLTPGVHNIKIVTDADAEVAETDETNNEAMFTMTVAASDLSIGNFKVVPTLLQQGTSARFVANVKNTGKATAGFHVKFSVNGTQVGALISVAGVNERDSITVTSDPYIVTSDMNTCGELVTVQADAGSVIAESSKANNDKSMELSADLAPFQLPQETGSASNPAVIRINKSGNFFPAIRNLGARDASGVRVRYLLNGVEIGTDSLVSVKAGVAFAAHGAFSHVFESTGNFTIQVVADPLNTVCELNENNNSGSYFIRVVDSKPDLELLSQFISPSSLNPQPDQNITIVGTVRNSGGKVSTASVMRFFVDNVQLGNDVSFNSILPGKDTTVQATLSYSSPLPGTKIMKILVDPISMVDEEIESNNEATRALIVGEAPDMARRNANAIRFNPGGFTFGDSVIVSYAVINNGTIDGVAWVRFVIEDANGSIRAIDSVPFSLVAGGATVISKKMLFDVTKGRVRTEIYGCTPVEYDFENNKDTLEFTTIAPLTRSLTVNGNLDMKQAIQDELPGWIGGKLLLGDYDLTVNGSILHSDSAHFIVTNGTGKLKLANNNPENLFPVGADISHGNFVKISNAGTPDNFTVRVVPYVLLGGNTGDTVRTGNVERTWFIDEQTPGGSDATIQFVWNSTDEQPGFDRLQSRAAHYTNAWQLGDLGAALADSLGRFSLTQANYSSFSPFTVTSVNTALPLTLLRFSAVEQTGDVLLQWVTDEEVNTAYFMVQHSYNGRDFEMLGQVVAYNRPDENTYGFRDQSPSDGLHYYRLQMVDKDGRYTYSTVQKVAIYKKPAMSAYPNPASQNITVKGLQAGGTLRLISMDGKAVRQWAVAGNTLRTNLSGLPSGMYVLRYQFNGEIQQIKIMKE